MESKEATRAKCETFFAGRALLLGTEGQYPSAAWSFPPKHDTAAQARQAVRTFLLVRRGGHRH